jgi:hypothetical protein
VARGIHDWNLLTAELVARSAVQMALPDSAESAIRAVYQAGLSFFAEPRALRLGSRLEFDCGYCAYGEEHSGDVSRPDRVESFKASARTVKEAKELDCGSARELHSRLIRVFDELEYLAEQLLFSLALHFGRVGGATGLRGTLREWSQIQLNYSLPTTACGIIQTEHEDGHLLTIAHSNSPGLEIAHDGSYLPAVRAKGEAVVMLGELARLLTGGDAEPAYHRVRALRGGQRRLSLVFFADMEPEACLAWREGAVNAGVDIGSHVRRNAWRFGLAGFDLRRDPCDNASNAPSAPFQQTKRRITRDYATSGIGI